MKFTPWLGLLFLVLFSGTTLAADITLDHDELEVAFQDILLSEVPWERQDLVIDNFTCSPSHLTIPTGVITYTVLNQIHPQYLGSKTLSVMVNVDGIPQQKLKMNGVLNLYGDVVVTTHKLRRNAVITEDDLALSRRKITGYAQQLIPSIADAVGLEVTQTLGPGAILLSRYVKKQPLVHRGDMVTILVASGNLKITAHGEAKGKGAEGDMIKIKNLASRRIISARVVDRGLVEVDF